MSSSSSSSTEELEGEASRANVAEARVARASPPPGTTWAVVSAPVAGPEGRLGNDAQGVVGGGTVGRRRLVSSLRSARPCWVL
eukprot:1632522-Alexandrium_andersonii.AAC.1